MKLVLGLTGANASGKGEIAAYLLGRGFAVHSLSDVVRDEAARRGLAPVREHLIRIGNELRRELGAGVLAERIVARLGERDVVDSIRNPVEVAVLRRLVPHFFLLGVRAPLDVRYHRALSRSRPGDPDTLEGFRQRELAENTTVPHAQQLDETFRLADRVLDNDTGLAELHRAIERTLTELTAG